MVSPIVRIHGFKNQSVDMGMVPLIVTLMTHEKKNFPSCACDLRLWHPRSFGSRARSAPSRRHSKHSIEWEASDSWLATWASGSLNSTDWKKNNSVGGGGHWSTNGGSDSTRASLGHLLVSPCLWLRSVWNNSIHAGFQRVQILQGWKYGSPLEGH